MTEFYLVRHALPTAGVVDPPLSDAGRDQAIRLGRWFQADRFDALAVSPLRRAAETAQILAEFVGTPPSTSYEELREIEPAATTGQHYVPAEQLGHAHPVAAAIAEGRYDDVLPRAEWDRFRAQGLAARARLVERYPEGRVLVVAHGGIINAMLATLLGLDGVFWYYPGYTSYSRMELLRSGRLVIHSVNEMPHLADATRRGHSP